MTVPATDEEIAALRDAHSEGLGKAVAWSLVGKLLARIASDAARIRQLEAERDAAMAGEREAIATFVDEMAQHWREKLALPGSLHDRDKHSAHIGALSACEAVAVGIRSRTRGYRP